jgi:MFS transporter, DHA2 family, multidrug resistance protein
MVFVPLSTISMGTLRDEQIGNASGLFNLMRNVGGGIGISIVNTLVARHAQIHRAELVENLSPGNPAFQQTLETMRGAMARQAPPNVATERAYGLIQNTLDAQSFAFSYVDVFRYIALACFGCGLIVFFMQRVRAKKGAAAMAH